MLGALCRLSGRSERVGLAGQARLGRPQRGARSLRYVNRGCTVRDNLIVPGRGWSRPGRGTERARFGALGTLPDFASLLARPDSLGA
jgi:hypothetical protein